MSEITEAAQRRAEAAEQRRDNLISALELERLGYVRRGLEHRVAEVDEQIKWVKSGFTPEPEVTTPDAETTAEKTAAADAALNGGTATDEPAKPAAKPAARKPAAKK